MKTLIAVLADLTTIAFAEAPKWGDDWSKAAHQATCKNRLGFIMVGCEQCWYCQATKRLVNERKILVCTDSFVIADLNIDGHDQVEFIRNYKKLEFGSMLPFVVVTNSRGKALEHASGFKSADHGTKVTEDAKAQAAGVKK